ncbi:MAG: SGNH/GDSL hydrolase family protein [Bacteroidetes bacterium]|nr:SGNH/GDSL hydrolase family protein [Bacteroidota bacterium]
MQIPAYKYLALGDSYTIGEQVAEQDNFPHQVVQLLQEKGILFEKPLIIAKTGWTTDELQDQLQKTPPTPPYDIASLLIGVNNQYRGRSSEEYAVQFEQLLKQAIEYTGGKNNRVIVLSIPDWGVTPFAADRDRKKIAQEINTFNALNKKIASRYKVHYIDITPFTREAVNDVTLLTGDGLHPSGKDYKRWAELVVGKIGEVINN